MSGLLDSVLVGGAARPAARPQVAAITRHSNPDPAAGNSAVDRCVGGAVRARFIFPNPVNEHAARVVALGVVVMSVITLAFDQHWLLFVIAYGFVARVLAGPTLSPLGRIATQVVVPLLGRPPKLVPGPPKRFAQSIGAVFSLTALVLHFGFGATLAADVVLGLLVIAASLEAFFAACLGCIVFRRLMRAGVISREVCESCDDPWGRAAA